MADDERKLEIQRNYVREVQQATALVAPAQREAVMSRLAAEAAQKLRELEEQDAAGQEQPTAHVEPGDGLPLRFGASDQGSGQDVAESGTVPDGPRPASHKVSESLNTGKSSSLTYTPPDWGGPPQSDEFEVEIIKGGQVLGSYPLKGKSYFTFGRHPKADFVLEHPTSSRLHAVLQFRGADGAVFLYDPGSARGTLINKKPIPAKQYCQLRVGDQFRLGQSSRLHILNGPPQLMPEEAPSLAARKQQKVLAAAIAKHKQDQMAGQAQMQAALRGEMTWGMDDDVAEASHGEVDWKTYEKHNKLTEKQRKQADKLRQKQWKLQHLQQEAERLRAKARRQEEGLTSNQAAQLHNAELGLDRLQSRGAPLLYIGYEPQIGDPFGCIYVVAQDEIEDLEEALTDSIRHSLASKRAAEAPAKATAPPLDESPQSDGSDEFFDRTNAKRSNRTAVKGGAGGGVGEGRTDVGGAEVLTIADLVKARAKLLEDVAKLEKDIAAEEEYHVRRKAEADQLAASAPTAGQPEAFGAGVESSLDGVSHLGAVEQPLGGALDAGGASQPLGLAAVQSGGAPQGVDGGQMEAGPQPLGEVVETDAAGRLYVRGGMEATEQLMGGVFDTEDSKLAGRAGAPRITFAIAGSGAEGGPRARLDGNGQEMQQDAVQMEEAVQVEQAQTETCPSGVHYRTGPEAKSAAGARAAAGKTQQDGTAVGLQGAPAPTPVIGQEGDNDGMGVAAEPPVVGQGGYSVGTGIAADTPAVGQRSDSQSVYAAQEQAGEHVGGGDTLDTFMHVVEDQVDSQILSDLRSQLAEAKEQLARVVKDLQFADPGDLYAPGSRGEQLVLAGKLHAAGTRVKTSQPKAREHWGPRDKGVKRAHEEGGGEGQEGQRKMLKGVLKGAKLAVVPPRQ